MTNGEGFTALHVNIERKARRGYSVDTGGAVTVGSGDTNTPDTLTVSAGDGWAAGDPVSWPTTDVEIANGDNDPRKDVVFVDPSGQIQVQRGTPAPIPSRFGNRTRFNTPQPAPPDLSTTDGIVLAEVFVGADTSALVSDDVADRRVFATRREVLTSRTLTLSGGATPAADQTFTGVARGDQLQDLSVIVTPDADPPFNGDYSYTVETARGYDDSAGETFVRVQVDWQVDPGQGADFDTRVYVINDEL